MLETFEQRAKKLITSFIVKVCTIQKPYQLIKHYMSIIDFVTKNCKAAVTSLKNREVTFRQQIWFQEKAKLLISIMEHPEKSKAKKKKQKELLRALNHCEEYNQLAVLKLYRRRQFVKYAIEWMTFMQNYRKGYKNKYKKQIRTQQQILDQINDYLFHGIEIPKVSSNILISRKDDYQT